MTPASSLGGGLDRPEVVAQVRAAFERYERALVTGDVAVLTELFWDDPRCVRFGVADRQRRASEIAAWRRAHPSVPPGRRLSGTTVLAVDDRTAVVTTLFHHRGGAVTGGPSREGRVRPGCGSRRAGGSSRRTCRRCLSGELLVERRAPRHT